jgi:NAD-dependent deacetylase
MSAFAQSPKIVVLTGPGLSRESGFAPFDSDGMPARLRIEDVVTREGFERDKTAVQGFYNRRRRELLAAKPNPAHEALGVLDMARRNELLIVTRNIDDFHERTGAKAVIHTHGELLKARCLICTNVSERYDDITDASACPVCGNAGDLRPNIVWVGEAPLRMETVYEAVSHCRLLLVIGAAATAEPWSGLLSDAHRTGARTVEFAAGPSGAAFSERVIGPLSETVPAYVKQLIAQL